MRSHGQGNWSRRYRLPLALGSTAFAVTLLVFIGVVFQVSAKRAHAVTNSRLLGRTRLDAPIPIIGTGVVLRPVYPYSVLPGGAYDGTELMSRLQSDVVAARHYRQFALGLVRTVAAHRMPPVYVSFRKDGSIYWTRNRVRIPEGETLLTDGTEFARARCGNRISMTPQKPVAEMAMLESVLDIPESWEETAAQSPVPNVTGGSTGSPSSVQPSNLLPLTGVVWPSLLGPVG